MATDDGALKLSGCCVEVPVKSIVGRPRRAVDA